VTFLLLNAVATPLIFSWKSPYDGIRLFLTALPFLAMIAGEGIDLAVRSIESRAGWGRYRTLFGGVLAALVLLEIGACYRFHPFQLAYYSPLVGGIVGANRLGFETTYWCDSLDNGIIETLAREYPRETNIRLYAIDSPPFEEYRKAGLAPKGWRFDRGAPPDLHLIQFRQGFFGPVETRLLESGLEIVGENSILGIPLIRVYRAAN